MKPASFEYVCPARLDEAVALLAGRAGEAKILAGGQSLVPMLNFRMLRPSRIVDINCLTELNFVEAHDGGLRIGALTRHHALETAPLVKERFPVIGAAMTHVAHLAVRNRGTIGGSLSHADPAAELPMIAVLLDAEIHTRSGAGARCHAAQDFFVGPLSTVLADDEIVTEIVFSGPTPQAGWGFEEFALRKGDFAIAAVAATLAVSDGRVAAARLAATGIGDVPLRLHAAEARLVGQRPEVELIAAAAEAARDSVQPFSDLRASADYRRHLVAVLAERALATAWARAPMNPA